VLLLTSVVTAEVLVSVLALTKATIEVEALLILVSVLALTAEVIPEVCELVLELT
jgi:hypothetical protein